jgi:hypothetical protein
MFQTLLVALGWVMLFLLAAGVIIMAAISIMLTVIRFFQKFWKLLAAISLCVVFLFLLILCSVPV